MPAGMTAEGFLARRERDHPGAPLGGVGPGLFFANHLLKYIDRPIGLISCGVGSPMKQWDPAQHEDPNNHYGQMMERIALAGGRVKGIVWWQGESDALTPGAADVYEKDLLTMVDAIRRDTGQPGLPFIYVQCGRFVHPYGAHATDWERVREAQRQATGRRKNMFVTAGCDLMLEDSIHIGFEGYQRLGPRLAEIALSQVYGLQGHGAPITLDKIEVLQPKNRRLMIRVRFNGVSGRLTAADRPMGFELRGSRPADDPSRAYPHPPPPEDAPVYVIYRVDFDPTDPAALILGVFDSSPIYMGKPHPLRAPLSLVYGGGLDPYVNIVDEKDIPIPAFGPVKIALPEDVKESQGGNK